MEYYKLLTQCLIPLVLCLIGFAVWQDNRLKKLRFEKTLDSRILELTGCGNDVDRAFSSLLETVAMLVECNSYALYVMDQKSGSCFALRSIRQAVQSELNIVPNYIGLAPYIKDAYTMPLTLPTDVIFSQTMEIREGQVNLVVIPLSKDMLILAGPIKNIPPKTRKALDALGGKAGNIVSCLLKLSDSSYQAKEFEVSERASKKISGFLTNVSSIIEMVMKMALITLGADGAVLLCRREGSVVLETALGIDKESMELFKNASVLDFLIGIPRDTESAYISDFDERFVKIRGCFNNDNIKFVLFHRSGSNVAVFYFLSSRAVKSYHLSALQVMMTRISEIINHYDGFKKIAESNMDILKMMANLVDNLRPSTVGYSHLMYRYAMIIARELGLSEEETEDTALAAFLSNIGAICLSDDLFGVTGIYTELEFETMKLHVKVGASLVETTTGNLNVARCILYHHERYDGHGYPTGISGESIPIGSRILAVVQTFLATISSRDYRPALPFPLALEALKAAAGSQLDSKVVNALVGWFERKQKECAAVDGPLGPCWEMRLSPQEICADCPAYKAKSRKCWEYPDARCRAHGNDCETCFIKSEYVSRIKDLTGI